MTSQSLCLMKKLVLSETPATEAHALREAPASIAPAQACQVTLSSLLRPRTVPVVAPKALPHPRQTHLRRPRAVFDSL